MIYVQWHLSRDQESVQERCYNFYFNSGCDPRTIRLRPYIKHLNGNIFVIGSLQDFRFFGLICIIAYRKDNKCGRITYKLALDTVYGITLCFKYFQTYIPQWAHNSTRLVTISDSQSGYGGRHERNVWTFRKYFTCKVVAF